MLLAAGLVHNEFQKPVTCHDSVQYYEEEEKEETLCFGELYHTHLNVKSAVTWRRSHSMHP